MDTVRPQDNVNMGLWLGGDSRTPPLVRRASPDSLAKDVKTFPASVLKPFDREKKEGRDAFTPPPTPSTALVTPQHSTDTVGSSGVNHPRQLHRSSPLMWPQEKTLAQ